MEIKINNDSWIRCKKEDGEFFLAFDGDDFNTIKICNIKKRHIKQLLKDITELTLLTGEKDGK